MQFQLQYALYPRQDLLCFLKLCDIDFVYPAAVVFAHQLFGANTEICSLSGRRMSQGLQQRIPDLRLLLRLPTS